MCQLHASAVSTVSACFPRISVPTGGGPGPHKQSTNTYLILYRPSKELLPSHFRQVVTLVRAHAILHQCHAGQSRRVRVVDLSKASPHNLPLTPFPTRRHFKWRYLPLLNTKCTASEGGEYQIACTCAIAS
jgi:hypothetical protein